MRCSGSCIGTRQVDCPPDPRETQELCGVAARYQPCRIASSSFPILRMSPSGLVIPLRKEVAGHTGQVTDQPELVFDGRGIGDQPGVIDIAVVDGGSRIEMTQVCT